MSVRYLVLALLVFSFPFGVSAQPPEEQPATHMWLDNGPQPLYVPALTLKGCEVLTKQASRAGSYANGSCYFREKFLKQFRCRRSGKAGAPPKCTEESSP